MWSLLCEMTDRDRFPALSESEFTSLLDQKNQDHDILLNFVQKLLIIHFTTHIFANTSSQSITSRVYQQLLYLLANQIAHQGF